MIIYILYVCIFMHKYIYIYIYIYVYMSRHPVRLRACLSDYHQVMMSSIHVRLRALATTTTQQPPVASRKCASKRFCCKYLLLYIPTAISPGYSGAENTRSVQVSQIRIYMNVCIHIYICTYTYGRKHVRSSSQEARLLDLAESEHTIWGQVQCTHDLSDFT